MYSKEERIQINATPERVYRYVTDLRRHPEWSSNEMEMHVEGEPVQPGSTFTTSVKAFGSETAKGKVVDMQEPSLFSYDVDTSSSGHYLWTMRLTPSGNGTELSHRFERLAAPGWFKVMQAVMFPIIGRGMMVKGLQNIKARIEGEP